jgi:hydrogenase maturation protease
MKQQLVDTVVNAVLYEGYILYPYRASAKKNRQRFTFGRVYPEAYSRAQQGAEPCSMQTECLAEGFSSAALEITVRFLHPILRDVGELSVPTREMPAADNPDFFHVVPELVVDGAHHASWQEAVERAVTMPALTVEDLLRESREVPFSFPAARTLEPIRDRAGLVAGVIIREQDAVAGTVELSAEPVDAAVTKISVRVVNQTPVPRGGFDDNDELVMRTFASTHTILHIRDGAFLSMIDPPEAYAPAAALCRNLGTWPILVGDEAKQERDTLISSPIILYDYPKIAAESPGDLFDAGEIELVLEDDPGRDLGIARMPSHRSFYGADKVEPLEGE